MKQRIAHIALVVNDYDEAIKFYTEQLDFRLIEDTKLSETKRWVMVAPPGATECCLLLAKAADDQQRACVGNQTGGRVFLFLFTDDLWRDYHKMQERGIHFTRPPREEVYGTVAVFEDLYGNLWDLLEPNDKNRTLKMTTTDPKSIALQFNDYINDRNLDGLAQLMTDDHTFIDTADNTMQGKQSCLAGWREFFRLFPDYKNIFETVKAKGTLVIMMGHSTCADHRLEGPALWTAKIRDEKVATWRVYEDTADNRQRLHVNDE